MKTTLGNKNRYRLVIIVLAIVQVVGFFCLPFASIDKSNMLGGLGSMASSYSGLPNWLTGLRMLMMLGSEYADAVVGGVLLLISTGYAVAEVMMHWFGKGKASYILTIIFSVFQIGNYAIGAVVGNEFVEGTYGMYKFGPAVWVLIPAAIAALTFAIIGLVNDRQTAAGGKTVTRSKKDGVLIGMNGAYAGAQIPLHDGETVLIGRDPGICSIVLKGGSTSRKHCAVRYDAQRNVYTVTDYSSNGVFDQTGKRLQRGWEDIMRIGDEIRIGNSIDVFRFG